MEDIFDTIKLLLVASLFALVAGAALSFADDLPIPIMVAMWFAGSVSVATATIYTIAGIVSAKAGLRTMRGSDDA